MELRQLPLDLSLLQAWDVWVRSSLTRFSSSGYAESARTLPFGAIAEAISGPSLFFSCAIDCGEKGRGILVAEHSQWEESVLKKPVARIVLLAADCFEAALYLSRSLMDVARNEGVVLLTASPGHSPEFVHAALGVAGFHVASQALTVRIDLEAVAPALSRIPIRGNFRLAVPADTETIIDLARRGIPDARFTADPIFPKALGVQLFGAWAENLCRGAADAIVVAEFNGRVVGFASMTLDENRRSRVPALLAIEPTLSGWGIGAMLVRKTFEWYQQRGVRILIGGTEKNNIAINALYAKLGISFLDCNLVYHASPGIR